MTRVYRINERRRKEKRKNEETPKRQNTHPDNPDLPNNLKLDIREIRRCRRHDDVYTAPFRAKTTKSENKGETSTICCEIQI
jgi:hypothetical protein